MSDLPSPASVVTLNRKQQVDSLYRRVAKIVVTQN